MEISKLSLLRDAIVDSFSLSELEELCFDLNISFDNLPGNTKKLKAQNLISHLQRLGQLDQLVDRAKQIRPNFFVNNPSLSDSLQTTNLSNQISVECADIADFPCDVLILKYAQARYGADAYISDLLNISPEPLPDEFIAYNSSEKIKAKTTVFVGVTQLYKFKYEQIRVFSEFSLKLVVDNHISANHVAMTMHGAGYGLDEKESFLAQIAGIAKALENPQIQGKVNHITIVEKNYERAKRLNQLLSENLLSQKLPRGPIDQLISKSVKQAGVNSLAKPHIFIAMPFNEKTEDIYTFGIQEPVNSSGFLCERIDMTTFTGDILAQIKSRIETAHLIIADLSGANPNVYLEVGYAWGRNQPTLLIASNSEELRFDVKGQRCIIYKNIKDLAQKIKADLDNLKREELR